MDPYIEGCGLWGDFHHTLVAEIHRALAETAPERYLVRTGERSYLVLIKEEKEARAFLPDVSVTTPRKRKRSAATKTGVATAEPVTGDEPVSMRAFIVEEHRESFVEIYEADPEQRLIAAIEVLSPSNKRPGSEGRDLYLRKRQSLILGVIHLVEIDLLRGGEKMPMIGPYPACPYTLLLARARDFEWCHVWRGHFHKPLPRIPVPLLKPDPDLWLDLQPMVEAIYRRSRYQHSIDYTRPLAPPLTTEETAWLQQHLRAGAG
jgi:hypothetical protein